MMVQGVISNIWNKFIVVIAVAVLEAVEDW